jgi:hypothetical protein
VRLLYLCHLTKNGIASYSKVSATDAAQYPKFVPEDPSHLSDCFEAIGETEAEALAAAKAFQQERSSKETPPAPHRQKMRR